MGRLFLSLHFLSLIIVHATCDIGDRIQKLELLLKENLREHKELKERLGILEVNISDLSKEMVNGGYLDMQSGNIESQRIKQTSILDRKISKREPASAIAFHAYLSSSRHYSNHEILTFDKVTIKNTSYTPDDGIYDIPATGVYIFTWTIAVPALSPRIVTELVVHGSIKGVLTSDPDKGVRSTSGVHPSTAFVVAHAGIGDNVFVRVRNVASGDGVVLSDSNNVHSTFSAWRLL